MRFVDERVERARRWARSLEGVCILIGVGLGALTGLAIGNMGVAARGDAIRIDVLFVVGVLSTLGWFLGRGTARVLNSIAVKLGRLRQAVSKG